MLSKYITGKRIKKTAFYMIILTLLMFSLVSRLSARFVSQGISSDSARVAKFDIKESGIFESLVFLNDFHPGDIKIQDIEIKNNSEVAVNYTTTLSHSRHLPLNITIEGLDVETMSATGYIPAGNKVTKQMTIEWPEAEDDYKYSGMVDVVKITISAEQVD